MENRITEKQIKDFAEYLHREERSESTAKKSLFCGSLVVPKKPKNFQRFSRTS